MANRRFLAGVLGIVGFIGIASAQRAVVFSVRDRSATAHADLYGSGTRGVILAHGGRFDEKSWQPQAAAMAAAGFHVIAIRFRGDAFNPDGSPSSEGSGDDNAADILGAIAYLRSHGAKTIAVVGASLGGDAAGLANREAPGSIDRIVFLGSSGGESPEKLTGRKLFIVARADANSDGPRMPRIAARYARARQPKKLVVVEGKAHAQFLFDTDQGPRVLGEILQFISAP